MSNLDDELRALLGRKADEVQPHVVVPSGLTSRVRRRMAMNAVAVGAGVAALAVGAVVGVRAITPDRQGLIGPAASSTAITSCTSGQLRATGAAQGAAGSRIGTFRVTNFSDKTCTLQGTPTITLLDQNLKPITSGVKFTKSPAGWVADASPQPSGWPVVTLEPGEAASIRFRWTNWCPSGRAAPLWRIGIPNGGSIDVVNGIGEESPPPCNGPGLPSTIEVGPFEPPAA